MSVRKIYVISANAYNKSAVAACRSLKDAELLCKTFDLDPESCVYDVPLLELVEVADDERE